MNFPEGDAAHIQTGGRCARWDRFLV